MAEERKRPLMSLREWLLRPKGLHAWRWRMLTAWVIAFTAIVGVLFRQHHDQTQRAERLAIANSATNMRQQATIVALCDRGYILLGLVQAAVEQTRVQYKDDLKTRPATAAADLRFISQFQSYQAELIDQLTAKGSPCVTATR